MWTAEFSLPTHHMKKEQYNNLINNTKQSKKATTLKLSIFVSVAESQMRLLRVPRPPHQRTNACTAAFESRYQARVAGTDSGMRKHLGRNNTQWTSSASRGQQGQHQSGERHQAVEDW